MKCIFKSCSWMVFAVVSLLLAGPAFAQTTCVVDDFSDGDFSDWILDGVGNANQVSAALVDVGGGDLELALTADGSTAYYGADNAGFLYQEMTGDFRIETTVDSTPMVTGKPWRKAGLMARASLDHLDIRLLTTLVPAKQRMQFVARETYGGVGNVKVATEVYGAPSVVRLAVERVGQELTVEYSLDAGTTWIQPTTGLGGSINIAALPETLLVGLVMVSNNISVTSTAHFDDVASCVENSAGVCDSNPCLNGGTCNDEGDGTYSCDCTGPQYDPANNCVAALPNSCDPNPCMNGGLCAQDRSGAIQCICPAGTDPQNYCASNAPLPCLDNPCQNGGSCIDNFDGTYRCLCTSPQWDPENDCT